LFPTGEPRQIGGMPDLEHEKRLGRRVCGIDEAGRGPWAGPVVAAAVIVAPELIDPGLAGIIDDSKNFSHTERLDLHAAITRAGSGFACAWAEAAVEEIDTVNILQATFLAMNRALGRLEAEIDHALVDGNIAPPLACPATPLIGGDGLSLSIAAASLVAKVERDRIMLGLAEAHPGYGWETNMGYGTPAHARALEALGPTPHHRRSFAPVARAYRKIRA
jgi:ribonuclease HII